MCGVNPRIRDLISRSNPAITANTTIRTKTPTATPSSEIRVIAETCVRSGFRYRSARVMLNDFRAMRMI